MRISRRLVSTTVLGLVTGAVILASVTSASALPPGRGAADSAPRPTARLASVPAAATSAVAAPQALPGFSVNADSVVGTAYVPRNWNPATSVSVSWGDGYTTSGFPGQQDAWFGTIALHHEYAPSPDGSAFYAVVTAVVAGQSDYRYLLVTPRYWVTQSTAYFSPMSHCDSTFENETEWHVDEKVHSGTYDGPEVVSKSWDFDRTTYEVGNFTGPNFQPLPGSEYGFEMTMASPSLWVTWPSREIDPIFDDVLNVMSVHEIHPRLGNQAIHSQNGQFSGDCAADVQTNISVQLLKPGIGSTPATPPPAPAPAPNPGNDPFCRAHPGRCVEP